MSEPYSTQQYKAANGHILPKPAVNLARRIMALAERGDGRHKIEIFIQDGEWRIIVNEGSQIEYLGKAF
jgi:hypothetical protein